MITNYPGIDYGLGQTNIDLKAGIFLRYGVISANALNEYVYEAFEPDYGEPTCPKCGLPAIDYDDEKHNEYELEEYDTTDYACEECKYSFGSEHAFADEPLSNNLDDGEYIATLDEYNDIFIRKAPYYTYAQFCSPCAPGAIHLENPLDSPIPNNKGYCFGHDWFTGNVAPYRVYSIATDEEIFPDKEA